MQSGAGMRRANERAEHRGGGERKQRKDPSEDRRDKSAVRLHSAEQPWRPSKERQEKDEKTKCLLRSIRGLLAGSTPARKDNLVKVFLEYRVHESAVLSEVISLIFDVAVDQPTHCDLYAMLCAAQVDAERREHERDSPSTEATARFKSEILKKVQETFNTKTISGRVEERVRKMRMGHINFIGHLYLQHLITMRFMHYRVLDLLKTIDERHPDEGLIECAVRLMEKIGKKMEEEEERVEGCKVQTIFDLLDKAKGRVSSGVRQHIANLAEHRKDGWWERSEEEDSIPAPRKEESRAMRGGREEEEKENHKMAERRQIPGRGGGRGRGGGGRGGWDGERRGNPRQDEAARPARPMQILMRRDHSPNRAPAAAAAAVDVAPPSDTTSSTSTTTMRNQRGTLDSTGVLAMLTGAAPLPIAPTAIKQRDASSSTAAAPSAASAAATMQQPRLDPRRNEQRRHDKMSARDALPKGQAAAAVKDVAYLGGKKVMRDACRIITENGELSEYLVNNLMTDFLSDANRDFRVVAAVGPQTSGKSTILSMMAGNQPLDLFRQYVFRPSSREAVEQSKHQSTKVSVYVSKARNIFIDCQPLSCVSILDEQIAQPNRGGGRGGGAGGLALQAHIENLQLLAWCLQVSHTVLVCHDWFLDLDIVKQLRTAELLRAATDEISAATQLPKLAPTRRANLLFVHTRARPDDFRPANRIDRAELLKRMFGGSLRIRLPELAPEVANWDGVDALPRPPVESIYFPLGEMKLREMSSAWQDERTGGQGGTGAGAHNRSNTGPMSPAIRTPQQRAREKEKESTRVKEFIADLSGAVPFDEGIVDLRRVLHLLPIDSFTPHGAELLTETQWFRFACGAWRDATFRSSVALLESTLLARRKTSAKRDSVPSTVATTDRLRTMKISEKA